MKRKLMNTLEILNQPTFSNTPNHANANEEEEDFELPMLDIPFEIIPYMSNK